MWLFSTIHPRSLSHIFGENYECFLSTWNSTLDWRWHIDHSQLESDLGQVSWHIELNQALGYRYSCQGQWDSNSRLDWTYQAGKEASIRIREQTNHQVAGLLYGFLRAMLVIWLYHPRRDCLPIQYLMRDATGLSSWRSGKCLNQVHP